MKIIKLILGLLLHYANRNVPFVTTESFYKLKKSILEKYGTKIDTVVQHIEDKCYSCDGTGTFKCSWKLPETCWSCVGTGLYSEYWIIHAKYKIGKYEFHVPVNRCSAFHMVLKEHPDFPIIEGRIKHENPKYHLARECVLWLYLFFDIKLFWKEFVSVGCIKDKRTPLVILSTFYFNVKTYRWKRIFQAKTKLNYSVESDADELPF